MSLHEIDPFLPAVLVGEQPSETGYGPGGTLDDAVGRKLAALADVGPAVLIDATERHTLLQHAGEWDDERAEGEAAALIERLTGRRIYLLGPHVAAAFEGALRLDSMPPLFAALRYRSVEIIRLPHLMELEHNAARAQEAGRIVRAEVDRYRKARSSWCTIRLTRPDLYGVPEDIIYHPTTGKFAGGKCNTAESWDVDDRSAHHPDFVDLDDDQREALLVHLAAAAGRVARWGAGVPCYVGPHSIDVAGRVAQLARAQGWDSSLVAIAVNLAAIHDLHECLPAHGDVPGPVVRALAATSPAWRRIEENGRKVITDLYASPFSPDAATWPETVAVLVKQADLECRATERALFFRDAPTWLGPRGVALAQAARRNFETSPLRNLPPELVYHYQPDVLLDAVRGRAPDYGPSAALLPIDPWAA